jgi:hypothetical protein
MSKKEQANAKDREELPVTTSSSKDSHRTVLVEIELVRWRLIPIETRQTELKFLNERFHELLNELYDSANLCVDRNKTFSNIHTIWRRVVIIGTGVVAITNLLAANKDLKTLAGGIISILAAVFAVVLAMLANLESFHNSAEKAQGYRESREFFLDAARDFDRRWDVYVRPFTDEAEACANAAELYRLLVAKDSELRAKFKELTKTEGRGSRSSGHTAN